MKRSASLQSDVHKSYLLPREIWVLVLGNIAFESLWQLRTVSLEWKEMVMAAVRVIEKMNSYWLTDEYLKQLVSLDSLSLHGTTEVISNEGISGLVNLTSLEIDGYYPVAHALEDGVCPPQITDDALSRLTNLTNLSIQYNSVITSRGVSALTSLRRLTVSEQIADDAIIGLKNLTYLNLPSWNQARISSHSVSKLTNLTELVHRAATSKINDDAISALTNLTKLDLLDNKTISDRGISTLTNIVDLRVPLALGVAGPLVSNEGVSRMVNLTKLSLGNRFITDAALTCFVNLKTLILTRFAEITDEGISRLTRLTDLDLTSNNMISDDGISGLTSLVQLILTDNFMIMNWGVSTLTNLTSLDVQGTDMINAKGIAPLCSLRHLYIDSFSGIREKEVASSVTVHCDEEFLYSSSTTDSSAESLSYSEDFSSSEDSAENNANWTVEGAF